MVRLDCAPHRALRLLSLNAGVPVQGLLVEAVGDLFVKHGVPALD